MRPVIGVAQHYAWGDPTFIPRLLGREPNGRPWAEWWLGTHPGGPATLDDGTPLRDLTGPLGYLLKVLAAAEPLSLQTHPDAARAAAGHRDGRYSDPNPKPELLCALTPFVALCGIRPVDHTVALLDELGLEALREMLVARGPGTALEALYRGSLDPGEAVDACRGASGPEATWITELADRYPGDPSVAVCLLLNLVELEPGEALRLDAGNLHAYLRGAGIELMGPSDNVVRGGLTVKPVDVEELLAVVDTSPMPDPVLPVSARYELPAANVALVRVPPGSTHVATGHELTVDLAGRTWYLAPGDRLDADELTFVAVPGSGDGETSTTPG